MTRFWLLFGGIWLIVGIPFAIIGVYQMRAEQHFEAARQPATGAVLSKAIRTRSGSGSSSSSRSHEVTYRFQTPDGRTFINTAAISSRRWDALSEGDSIDVEYLPDDPATNRVRGERPITWVFLLLGLVFGGAGAVIVALAVRGARTEKRLREHGVLADAVVVAVNETNVRINNAAQWRIEYEFSDERGERRRARSRLMPAVEAHRWSEGQKGYIRYDRDRPTKSIWLGTEQGS
jgi:uncharacterized protein DUF3592